MHIRDIQAAITDAVDSVDEFLMKVCALDERVEMHQRLNGVFKAMIHLVDEFSHSLLTTNERTVTPCGRVQPLSPDNRRTNCHSEQNKITQHTSSSIVLYLRAPLPTYQGLNYRLLCWC